MDKTPGHSFTLKTCYANTVPVISPRGLHPAQLSILHNSYAYNKHLPLPGVTPNLPQQPWGHCANTARET